MKKSLPNELMFLRNRKIKQHKTTQSMKGKVVVISGATSGVGKNAAEHSAKAGADIIIVARNHQKAEDLARDLQTRYQTKTSIYLADFSDLNSVRKAALELIQYVPKIDVLINSVGIHSTKKRYNKDGFEMVFCVNHLAVFLFTYLLLDTLKKSAPSRIIQVNSEGHRFNGLRTNDIHWKKRIYTGLRGYGASKTAQLLTTWTLADQLQNANVTINAMHPGGVKTNIGSNNGWLYRFFFRHFTWHFLKDVNISGESLYYLAADPSLDGITGRFFNLTIDEVPAKHALNKQTQQEIWDITLTLLQPYLS